MSELNINENILSKISKKFILLSSNRSIFDAISTLKNRKGDDTWFLILSDNRKYKYTRYKNLRKYISESEDFDLNVKLSELKDIFHYIECLDFTASTQFTKEVAKNNKDKIVLINWEDTILGVLDFNDKNENISCADNISKINNVKGHTEPIRLKLTKGLKNLALLINWTRKNVVFSILGFVILVGIPTLYFYLDRFYKEIKPMSGEWNIAVSSFYLKGNVGISKEDAQNMAKVFYNRLNSEIGDYFKTSNIICELRGPDEIELIEGDNEEERSICAQEVSKKINADVLIYGSIEKIGNELELKPEFYISIKNFYEADELIGNHILGRSIKLIGGESILPSQLNLNQDLALRSKVLSFVVRGLSYYLIHDYVNSYSNFKNANNDNFWESNEGRQIIYLLEGNAAGKSRKYDESKIAYLNAIKIDPEYSRAYIGLGSIYYLVSIHDKSSVIFNPNISLLNESISLFEKAIRVRNKSKMSNIKAKSDFGLGQAYLALWFTGKHTLDISVKCFENVLKLFNENSHLNIKEIAAESHARLGFIYFNLQKIDAALKEFEEALKLSSIPERRALYFSFLSDINFSKNNFDLANKLNENAIKEYEHILKSPLVNTQYIETLLNMSKRYKQQSKLIKSEYYAQKALNFIQSNPNEEFKNSLSNIFEQFAEIKFKLGKYYESTENYLKAVEHSNDVIQKAIYIKNIALNEKLLGHQNKSTTLSREAIDLLNSSIKNTESVYARSLIINKMSQIYEEMGDFENAIATADDSLKLLDHDSFGFNVYQKRLDSLKLKRGGVKVR